jgi:uncharacterized protein YgbK (DUF1537 family)
MTFKKYEKYRGYGPATEKQMDFLEKHSTFTRLEIYKMSKAEASEYIDKIIAGWEAVEADWEEDDER